MTSTVYDWLPAPPDDAAWWDAASTRDTVLHRLRLQSGDIDDTRVSSLIPVAGWLINNYIDACDAPPGPPPNPVLQEALIVATVNLYGKDPNTGNSNTDWAAMTVTTLADVDPLGTVRSMLLPFKFRFGVA